MTGCVKRRSTRTTTVLACLSLTTTPCSVRFGIVNPLLSRRALLLRDGFDSCDVAAHLAHPRRILELTRGALEAQVELLLLQLEHFVIHLVGAHRLDIG